MALDESAGERERRLRREGREPQNIQNVTAMTPMANATGNPANPAYNYRTDLGMFGDRRYSYQVGDEFHHPGPEPPRDSPEWNDWKAHAAAWRNYIGGRQQYVNSMIATGFDPEDLGIFNRKHEGMAGYKRLTMNNNAEINRLRAHGEQYMRGTDAEVDPTTGFYATGNGPDRAYYDARGMRVNAQGQRVGGFYGMSNTMAQYGLGAIPRMGQQSMGVRGIRPVGGRMERPMAPAAPTPMPRPTNVPMTGWGNRFGAVKPQRNRPRPYGI